MLVGFVGRQVPVEGIVNLQLMLDSQPWIKTMEVNFLVVSAHNNAYNAILGRPPLNKIRAIVSTPHLLMKFPTNQWINHVRGNQQMAK